MKEPQLTKCELELTLPFDYSKILDDKILKDLKFSKKGETVHLKHLEFDVNTALSLSIRELDATDAIPVLKRRRITRAMERYMPREIVNSLLKRIYSELDHEFKMIQKKYRLDQLYRLEAHGDSFGEVHSILTQILEAFPQKKRTIVRRRFQVSIRHLSDIFLSNVQRILKEMGLPKSAISRVLIAIREEEHMLRHTGPREYSLSDFA